MKSPCLTLKNDFSILISNLAPKFFITLLQFHTILVLVSSQTDSYNTLLQQEYLNYGPN